jgi:hypothetical protein
MSVLNQVDHFVSTSPNMFLDPHESVVMECGRLIHAAVISKRFLNTLLTNPLKTIDDGFCGEKFSFTREEKQQIKQIHASSLAEFSNLLILAVKQTCCAAPTAELAFAHLETHPEISA